MSPRETSMSRSSGDEEDMRRQDGGGERDPLPQSEENRGDQPDKHRGTDDPAEAEPIRSALRHQSQVSPEDYEGTSQSGGSSRADDKV
jgi:hypothetical protein